jgi:hypothetical protein
MGRPVVAPAEHEVLRLRGGCALLAAASLRMTILGNTPKRKL